MGGLFFMRTINNMLESVLKIDLPQAVDNSFDATKKDYVGLQKDQMFAGIRNDGEAINPLHGRYTGYAQRTIDIKRSKGQVFTHVTLKDKEDFYKGVFMDPRSEGLVVDSLDEKTDSLTAYYGDEIFGLADERKQTFANLAGQVLVKEIEKQM